jgi:fluoride exporter
MVECALQTILLISLGGAIGANLRYFVAQQLAKLTTAFPYGTLAVNVTGSLIIGFFLVWTTDRVLVDPRWRLLIAVGFCGGYTTFSSYAFETFALVEQGRWLAALTNVLASNLSCLLGVVFGAMLARSL